MPGPTPAVNLPFHTVVVPSNGFHAGFEDRTQAVAGAVKANEQAETLGIKGRYEVVDGPRKAAA